MDHLQKFSSTMDHLAEVKHEVEMQVEMLELEFTPVTFPPIEIAEDAVVIDAEVKHEIDIHEDVVEPCVMPEGTSGGAVGRQGQEKSCGSITRKTVPGNYIKQVPRPGSSADRRKPGWNISPATQTKDDLVDDGRKESPVDRRERKRPICSDAEEYHFFCDICGKFYEKSSLERHMKMHTASEKQFVCILCDKAFGHRQRLEYHILVHAGDRPFSCGHCNKSFREKSKLSRHMGIHRKYGQYACLHCQETFASKESLDRHADRENPFLCGRCKKSFGCITLLIRHSSVPH